MSNKVRRVCPSCQSVYKVEKNAAVVCCRVCGRITLMRNTRSDTHNSLTEHEGMVLKYRRRRKTKITDRFPFIPLIAKKKEVSKMADIMQAMASAGEAIKQMVDAVRSESAAAKQEIALLKKEAKREVDSISETITGRFKAQDARIAANNVASEKKVEEVDRKCAGEIATLRGDITRQSRTLTAKLDEKHDTMKKALADHIACHEASHEIQMGRKVAADKKEISEKKE